MKLIVNEKEREENRTLEDGCPIVDVFLFLFSVRVYIIALIHIASFLSLTHSVFFRSTTFHLFIDVSFVLSLSLSIFYCMKKSRLRLHAKKRWLTDQNVFKVNKWTITLFILRCIRQSKKNALRQFFFFFDWSLNRWQWEYVFNRLTTFSLVLLFLSNYFLKKK
jgi:hypothetical protein